MSRRRVRRRSILEWLDSFPSHESHSAFFEPSHHDSRITPASSGTSARMMASVATLIPSSPRLDVACRHWWAVCPRWLIATTRQLPWRTRTAAMQRRGSSTNSDDGKCDQLTISSLKNKTTICATGALLGVLFAFCYADQCRVPPPVANFDLEAYKGVWYEIGKIQTAGGAIFESSCVCTFINVTDPTSKDDEAEAINVCRKDTPSGQKLVASGHLTDQNPPGRFKESFFPFVPAVSYTIIFMDPKGEQYSVEYDCGETLGLVNYCVHILSRKPTMDADLLKSLVQQSLALGLNTQNLPFKATKQDGCWN